jgi:hypothetical protein
MLRDVSHNGQVGMKDNVCCGRNTVSHKSGNTAPQPALATDVASTSQLGGLNQIRIFHPVPSDSARRSLLTFPLPPQPDSTSLLPARLSLTCQPDFFCSSPCPSFQPLSLSILSSHHNPHSHISTLHSPCQSNGTT